MGFGVMYTATTTAMVDFTFMWLAVGTPTIPPDQSLFRCLIQHGSMWRIRCGHGLMVQVLSP